MKPIATLVFLGLCACSKKHEDATPSFEAVAVTSPSSSASIVALPTPSDTATASASSANDDPETAKRRALAEAAEFGMLGLLDVDGGIGNDPLSARGNMFGDQIGDSFGAGGIGVTGRSDAGGGGGLGIGLGNIGTLGHNSHSAKIRQGFVNVNGRLPPEVIQRIVRQNFGRFRLCYADGLRRDPKLAGAVATKFVIDASGAVSKSEREGSTTLTDAAVVQCVVRAFSNLSFPQPEGGIVSVVFPVIFAPPDTP
jgi:hypothetical protein